MTSRTPNINLIIEDFDARAYHLSEEKNKRIIDALWGKYFATSNLVGVWTNGTMYATGQRVVDPEDGSIWEALVSHTSAATGLFSADLANHPNYWENFSIPLHYKGAWTSTSVYALGDVINSSTVFAVAKVGHSANSDFFLDVSNAKWDLFLDGRIFASSMATYLTAASALVTQASALVVSAGTYATQAASYVTQVLAAGFTGTQSVYLDSATFRPRETSGASILATSVDTATNAVRMDGLLFISSASQYAQVRFVFPAKFDYSASVPLGAKIYCKPYGSSGAMAWQVRAMAQGTGQVVDTAFSAFYSSSVTMSSPSRMYAAYITGIVVGNLSSAGSEAMGWLEIARNTAVTGMAGLAELLGVELYMQVTRNTDQ